MTQATRLSHESVDLVSNYRPLGIKAVQAAVSVKSQQTARTTMRRPMGTGLPEGFHWPEDIHDE